MLQHYKLCDIAVNNGANGRPIWIIINGLVYDVSDFIKDHPGGEDIIREYAGKDASKMFQQVGHSKQAHYDLQVYRIGTVDRQCVEQCSADDATKAAGGTTTPEVDTTATAAAAAAAVPANTDPDANTADSQVPTNCLRKLRLIKLLFCFQNSNLLSSS